MQSVSAFEETASFLFVREEEYQPSSVVESRWRTAVTIKSRFVSAWRRTGTELHRKFRCRVERSIRYERLFINIYQILHIIVFKIQKIIAKNVKLISIRVPRAIFRSIKSTYTAYISKSLDSWEGKAWLEERGHDPSKGTRSAKKETRKLGGIVSGKAKIPYDRGQQLVRRR